jgi:hypothetical protein
MSKGYRRGAIVMALAAFAVSACDSADVAVRSENCVERFDDFLTDDLWPRAVSAGSTIVFDIFAPDENMRQRYARAGMFDSGPPTVVANRGDNMMEQRRRFLEDSPEGRVPAMLLAGRQSLLRVKGPTGVPRSIVERACAAEGEGIKLLQVSIGSGGADERRTVTMRAP